jgi:[glutamine synthetase] adenylyltransferase / [glutamine synthetase]-adenylyl-L-tyrosine phosphorylase
MPQDISFAKTAKEQAFWGANWPRPADPDRVLAHLGDFDLPPEAASCLAAILGNSPYLSFLLSRHPQLVMDLAGRGPDAVIQEIFADLTSVGSEAEDRKDLQKILRIAKQKAAFVIALADIGGFWLLADVTAALSRLADLAVSLSVDYLLRMAGRRGELSLPDPENPSTGSGLIVLGMGKLGAGELNYSSDIDLIVFYDDQTAPLTRPDDMRRFFVRFAQDLVTILSEQTVDGYVFRTDLRLRPDPNATPLAVSLAAAESYYNSFAQTWERAAMIKARQVAGDPVAGKLFFSLIRPFVWRRDLDFDAIEDIRAIKRQIAASKGHADIACEGHDVKVGRGGIREIEFFAQTQQLIFGGRDPLLREKETCRALAMLADQGHVGADVVLDLTSSYAFLRQVEHRLQMIQDQQTHRLPETPEKIDAFACFMGFADAASFRADLHHHLSQVTRHYARLFQETGAKADGPGNLVFSGPDQDPETLETLRRLGFSDPAAVIALVRTWQQGRYAATRTVRGRQVLTELLPVLLTGFAKTSNPDRTLAAFDQFLAKVPSGVSLFSLMKVDPAIVRVLTDILGASPYFAEVLGRTPSLFDNVMRPDFDRDLPSLAALRDALGAHLAPLTDYEDFLSACQSFVNDHRFIVGIRILQGRGDAERCRAFLSDLAEATLYHVMQWLEADFAKRHGRFPAGGVALLALGKLGEQQMSIRSDLDLIVIYDGEACTSDDGLSDGPRPLFPAPYYTRLTQNLVTALTAPTRYGTLYPIDLRLRPSGNAGPLATSLAAFARYQGAEAWTWEHLALTRARVLFGPPALVESLTQTIRETLSRPRDPDALRRDVLDMRCRIEAEHKAADPWDLKYCPGGMVDVDFIVQYLQLRDACRLPSILNHDMRVSLLEMGRVQILPPETVADLAMILDIWRRTVSWLAVTDGRDFAPDKASPAQTDALVRVIGEGGLKAVDFADLEVKLRATQRRVRDLFEQMIGPVLPFEG